MYWPELSSLGSPLRDITAVVFTVPMPREMPKDNNQNFEGHNPETLFREFAAECLELAHAHPSPEKRALFLRMASVWHQMAHRWEKKHDVGSAIDVVPPE
jgi:hypothetical protein